MKAILGIDPGLKGGYALINMSSGELMGLNKLPIAKSPLSGKKILDSREFGRTIREHLDTCKLKVTEVLCAVEAVNSMPKQGVVSVFRFGEGLGIIQGLMGALELSIYGVVPAVWKSALALGSDKWASLEKANRILGYDAFTKYSEEGQAEAFLIAHFVRTRVFLKPSKEPALVSLDDLLS